MAMEVKFSIFFYDTLVMQSCLGETKVTIRGKGELLEASDMYLPPFPLIVPLELYMGVTFEALAVELVAYTA